MMGRKCYFGVCMGLFLAVLYGSAAAAVTDPNIITAAAKIDSLAGEDLVIGNIKEGALTHVDRTFVFTDIADVNMINFVSTAVDDKNYASLQYDVTVDKAGTMFLLIDNRVGDGNAGNPPTLGNGLMDWVAAAGFTETGYTAGVLNPADQSVVTMTAYAAPVTAGTTSFYQQYDGTGRITYLIAAIPDGWNLHPSVMGVPASAQVAPGEALVIDNVSITDYGENTGTTVLWEQLDAGEPVSFSPSAASENVTVTFPEGEGNYTLRMTVTDGDGLTTSKTVEVSVQIPQFAVEAANWVEASNDTNKGPTSHVKSTQYMYARNNDAPRRRIQLISYDISGLKQTGEVFANSYLTLKGHKCSAGAAMSVYAVNEDLDNFDLDTGSWSNLPGVANTPVPSMYDPITLASLDLADLSELLLVDPSVPNNEWSNTDKSAALDEILNADDDGTVLLLFVTFSPENSDLDIFARDYGDPEPVTGLGGIILRGNVITPTWATAPSPKINSDQTTKLSQLSWTNPAGVGDITCDVYIGTGEPNSLLADYGYDTLATGISGNSVSLSGYTLNGDTTYNWIVDVTDSGTGETTKGYVWSFNVLTNVAPTVTIADPIQYLWLNNNGDPASATVVLDSMAHDDGIQAPLTYLWEQVDGPVTVAIDPNDVEDLTLALPATGTYTFKVTVDDGELTAFAAAEIVVADTPCDAAKAKPDYVANIADFNGDCYVNLDDFLTFAQQWLVCNPSMDAACE